MSKPDSPLPPGRWTGRVKESSEASETGTSDSGEEEDEE